MQTSAYEHFNDTRLHMADMQTLHSSAYQMLWRSDGCYVHDCVMHVSTGRMQRDCQTELDITLLSSIYLLFGPSPMYGTNVLIKTRIYNCLSVTKGLEQYVMHAIQLDMYVNSITKKLVKLGIESVGH